MRRGQWEQVAVTYRAAIERLAPDLPFLGGVVMMAILAGLPLFQLKLMSGHDTLAHLPRNVEFYEGLRTGQLFPRWAPDLGWGYGEPTFNFNPPLSNYLTAFFHVLGFTFVASEDLAMFALLVLAGLGMYLFAREFFGRRGGLVSAVAYLFAPYLLSRLYVSHALVDFSAFPFIPLSFWGLYRFVKEGRFPDLALAALSMALLVLSSNSVALITFPALLLFLVWLAWSRRSLRPIVRGLSCLLIGLGLSAFFLLPALAETKFVHIARRIERIDFHDHFVYLHQLIYSPWGYGLSVPGPGDEMSFAIGPVHLLLLLGSSLFLLRRVRSASSQAWLLASFSLVLTLGAAFFVIPDSLFIWEKLPLLQTMQFPFRFLSLIAVSTAFLCGFPFVLLAPENRRLANALMVAMISALLLFGLPHAKPQAFYELSDVDYAPRTIALKGIASTGREFEPIWVRKWPAAPAADKLVVSEGKAKITPINVTPFHYKFVVTTEGVAKLRVNTFYFPGWQVIVDGKDHKIDFSNEEGLMEFDVKNGTHRVEILFQDTPIRRIGEWLSILTMGTLGVVFAVGRRNLIIKRLRRFPWAKLLPPFAR